MNRVVLIAMFLCGCGKVFLDAVTGTDPVSTEEPSEETDSGGENDTGTVVDGRIMETLGRGLVAVDRGAEGVYLGWRLTARDPADIAFDVFRNNTQINSAPVTETTDYSDPDGVASDIYFVRATGAAGEDAQSETVSVLPLPYKRIPLDGALSVHKAGVGDLDGDGEYDVVLRRPAGTVLSDNTHEASTDTFKVEGYHRDGTLMWRIDLGWNIELGETFAPMLVYDLDGDGIAEVILKSAEGTVDGVGTLVGDTDGDGITDYRDEEGRVLSGPEFLSVYDGRTGAEKARAPWIRRGTVEEWGDTYGNRVNHNFLAVAYTDGRTPSIAAVRGIAELQVAALYDFRDGEPVERWTWSSAGAGAGYIGAGYHVMRVGDIDGDGRDEILPGAYALDDDGTALWTSYEGHGDRFHLADIDPDEQGLELWYCQESTGYYQHPVSLRRAADGGLLFGPEEDWGIVRRSLAADIDPRYPGMELWGTLGPLYGVDGTEIGPAPDSCNFAVYWDGDPLRELFDAGSEGGYTLMKWDWTAGALRELVRFDGDFVGYADLFGDWREELLIAVPGELRIYTTAAPAEGRRVTLMHDPVYRLGAAAETVGALQSPQPGEPIFP